MVTAGSSIKKVEGGRVTLVPRDAAKPHEVFENACFVENVGRISGTHSAFDTNGHVKSIVEFLSQRDGEPCHVAIDDLGFCHCVLAFWSVFCIVIWFAIVALVLGLGYLVIKPDKVFGWLVPYTTYKHPPFAWSKNAVLLWLISPFLVLFHAAVWLLCLLFGVWESITAKVGIPFVVMAYKGFVVWLLYTY